MEFNIGEHSTAEEFNLVREEILKLINTCGICEVRLEKNPVIAIDRSIVIHGERELLIMLIDPLLSRTDLNFSPEQEEGEFDPDCGTAIIYPLYEEKARDRPL